MCKGGSTGRRELGGEGCGGMGRWRSAPSFERAGMDFARRADGGEASGSESWALPSPFRLPSRNAEWAA